MPLGGAVAMLCIGRPCMQCIPRSLLTSWGEGRGRRVLSATWLCAVPNHSSESAQGPPLPPPEGTPRGRTVLCCEGQALSPVGPSNHLGSPTPSLHAPTHWQGATVMPLTHTCVASTPSPRQNATVALPKQPYAAVATGQQRSAIVVQPKYNYAIAAPPLGPCDTVAPPAEPCANAASAQRRSTVVVPLAYACAVVAWLPEQSATVAPPRPVERLRQPCRGDFCGPIFEAPWLGLHLALRQS